MQDGEDNSQEHRYDPHMTHKKWQMTWDPQDSCGIFFLIKQTLHYEKGF